MQGLFFRVDGADLETGEETYLVLQAPSSDHAEQIARRQGLLIASVRPATTADWGVSVASISSTAPAVAETIVIQGINSNAIETVHPVAECDPPHMMDLEPAIESAATSHIFPEVEPMAEVPTTPANSPEAFPESPAPPSEPPVLLDVASWMAARPPVEEFKAAPDEIATIPLRPAADGGLLDDMPAFAAAEPAAAPSAASIPEITITPHAVAASVNDLASKTNRLPNEDPPLLKSSIFDTNDETKNDETLAAVAEPLGASVAVDSTERETSPSRRSPIAGADPVRSKPRIAVLPPRSSITTNAMVRTASLAVPKAPPPKPLPQANTFAPKVPALKMSLPPAARRAPIAGVPADAPAASRVAPTTRPAASKAPVKLAATPASSSATATARPAVSSASPAARPASSARPEMSSTAAKTPKSVVPPRPLPPVVPPLRPIRLTPPTVKRIPPPIPAAASQIESPPVDEILVPPIEPAIETPPAIELAPEVAPMTGMLDGVVSSPVMETFHDMAPAAAQSQRVSGDVVAGSGVDQIVTKIAWDQTAHAVEHSSGSALEHLASAASSSYPPDERFDDPFATVSSAELAVADAEPASATDFEQSTAVAVEEITPAPSAIAADAFAQSAPASRTPYVQTSVARPNPMLAVFYVLAPFAVLVSGAGIGLVAWSMMTRVVPADFEDVAKLDFRITTLTYIILGGMMFISGLLILTTAALAYVAGALRSQRA